MTNRTVVVVAVLVLLLVALGAAGVVSGRPNDTEAEQDEFPVAAPYIEPTATAVLPDMPEADVPGEDLPDLPRYPGSVRVAYRAAELEQSTSVELEYLTLDSLDRVHEHVRNIISTFGWTLVSEEFSEQSQTFALAREREEVEIRLQRLDGRTVMSLAYTVQAEEAAAPASEPVNEPEPETIDEPASQPEPETVPEPAVQPEPPVESSESDDGNGGGDKDKQNDKPEQDKQEKEKQEGNPGNGGGNGPPEDKPDNNGNDESDDDDDNGGGEDDD